MQRVLVVAALVAAGAAVDSTALRPAQGRSGGQATRDSRRLERQTMVDDHIRGRGITDQRVLAAMRSVPRERFVPETVTGQAYADHPLPIGYGQTISQPYIVAYMSETLQVTRSSKVLEIGTGSGYQAAILGELAGEVYSIEIVPELADRARQILDALGYKNIHVRTGDGYRGWPEQAPFDRIMVTAAPDHVPQPLVDQLATGGRLVIPVGRTEQDLLLITRTPTGVVQQRTIPVRFVPLVRSPK
jgi:protein-L-isoaspartate(D-aspartate) O-methyltransferase